MNLILKNLKNHGKPVRLSVALLWLAGVFLIIVGVNQPRPAQAIAQSGSGSELFAQLCASCHQADGAGIVGTFPPLLDNPAATDPAYIADVIQNGKSGPIEVLGESYDSAMPAVGALAGDDLTAVVDYVVGLAGGGEAATEPVDAAPALPPGSGEADRGYELFIGKDRLDNGGVACSACHAAGSAGDFGGGSLGPDLNGSIDRLGG